MAKGAAGMNKDVATRLTGNADDLKKALADAARAVGDAKNKIAAHNKEMNSSFAKIGSAVRNMAGMVAAAFSINAIANFTKESMKLAATLEGIKKGFDQITYPGLLDELRKATKGTVTDMQLMSRSGWMRDSSPVQQDYCF